MQYREGEYVFPVAVQAELMVQVGHIVNHAPPGVADDSYVKPLSFIAENNAFRGGMSCCGLLFFVVYCPGRETPPMTEMNAFRDINLPYAEQNCLLVRIIGCTALRVRCRKNQILWEICK